MAISRSQLVKELEPGLNALFGMEYDRYEGEHAEIYETETHYRPKTRLRGEFTSGSAMASDCAAGITSSQSSSAKSTSLIISFHDTKRRPGG